MKKQLALYLIVSLSPFFLLAVLLSTWVGEGKEQNEKRGVHANILISVQALIPNCPFEVLTSIRKKKVIVIQIQNTTFFSVNSFIPVKFTF